MKKILLLITASMLMVASVFTLTACGEKEAETPVYKITYEYDGVVKRDGVALENKEEVLKADLVLPVAEKEGYKFNGWKLGGEAYEVPSKISKSVTVTPAFTPNDYEINYYISEELVEGNVEVTYDAPLTLKDITSFGNGYVWARKVGTNYVTFNPTTYNVTGDIDLYLVKDGVEFIYKNTISIDGKGGIFNTDKQTLQVEVNTSSETYTLPATCEKQGYEFKGWVLKGTTTKITEITLARNVNYEVEAVYEKIYLINYYGEDKTFISSQRVYQGQEYNMEEITERAGYSGSWKDSEGSVVEDGTFDGEDSIDVYLTYTAYNGTIKYFNYNGRSTGTMEDQVAKTGDKVLDSTFVAGTDSQGYYFDFGGYVTAVLTEGIPEQNEIEYHVGDEITFTYEGQEITLYAVYYKSTL